MVEDEMAQQCPECKSFEDDDVYSCGGCGRRLWQPYGTEQVSKYWQPIAVVAAAAGGIASALVLYFMSNT